MNLFSILSTFLEFVCIYVVIHFLLQKKWIPSYKDILSCIIIVTTLELIPSDDTLTQLAVGQLLYIIYMSAFYCNGLFETLTLNSLSSILVLLNQFVVVIIVSILGLVSQSQLAGTIYSLVTLLLIIIIFNFTPVRRLYSLVIRFELPSKIILINTYIFYIIFFVTSEINIHKVFSNPIYILCVVSIILSTNLSIIYYERHLQSQKHIIDDYEKKLPVYQSLIDDIRLRQHEYSNRIQTFQNLPMVCKDYESLCNSLSSYTKECASPSSAYPLLQINMPLFAAALYTLALKAQNESKNVHFTITNNNLLSSLPEYELVDIASILLQNAIEAIDKNETVCVHISSAKNKLSFEVHNPVKRYYSNEEIQDFFSKHYSSKSHHKKTDGLPHGLGLYSLSRIIEKKSGFIGAECYTLDEHYWLKFKFII